MTFITLTDDDTRIQQLVNLSQVLNIIDCGKYRTLNFNSGCIHVSETMKGIQTLISELTK